MRSVILSRRTTSRLAVASAAAAAAVLLPQAAAFAATVSVSTVSGTGYVANGTYKVGICSTKTYGVFGIPACATGVDATTDASGNLSVSFTASKTNANAHASIPVVGAGQPSAFTCKGAAVQDQCEVIVTDHNGTGSTIVARQNISFS
jgi:hypothetical protein